MILTGYCRLGKDIETRYTPNGKAVAELSVAYNYGRKDPNTNQRPSQWVRASLWGEERIKALDAYLLKGQPLVVTVENVHVEEYNKRDGGTGYSLVGDVISVQLAGSRPEGGQQGGAPRAAAPAPAPRPAPAPAPRQAAAPAAGFDNMDDDIPF